jgi:hypothetical protein
VISSALLKAFQNRCVFQFRQLDRHWFHKIFLHTLSHSPEPRQGDRPRHLWLISSIRAFQGLPPHDSKTHIGHIFLFLDQARVHEDRHHTKSKERSTTIATVYLAHLGFGSNENRLEHVFALRDFNVAGVDACPVHASPRIHWSHHCHAVRGQLVERIVVTTAILAVTNQSKGRCCFQRRNGGADLTTATANRQSHRSRHFCFTRYCGGVSYEQEAGNGDGKNSGTREHCFCGEQQFRIFAVYVWCSHQGFSICLLVRMSDDHVSGGSHRLDSYSLVYYFRVYTMARTGSTISSSSIPSAASSCRPAAGSSSCGVANVPSSSKMALMAS